MYPNFGASTLTLSPTCRLLWCLTGARPEAVLELHSRQINFEDGLVHLNPPGHEQVAKKYRPVVRLPDALWETFEGWAVSYGGRPVKHRKRAVEGL